MRNKILDKIRQSPEKQVNLAHMGIQDDELADIALELKQSHPKLAQLFLEDNGISDKGAAILGQELDALSDLSYIDLQFNKIDKQGATSIWGGLIEHHKNIKIRLHGNKITDEGEMQEIVDNARRKNSK